MLKVPIELCFHIYLRKKILIRNQRVNNYQSRKDNLSAKQQWHIPRKATFHPYGIPEYIFLIFTRAPSELGY